MTRGGFSGDFSCFNVLMSFFFLFLFVLGCSLAIWVVRYLLRIGLLYGVHEGNATYVLMPRIVALLTSISYQSQPLK